MIIAASAVLTPHLTHRPGWVEVHEETITGVGHGRPPHAADHLLDGTLTAGFIDAHVHGGGGYSFNDPDPEAADHISATHLAHGTTTMMASLVTAPIRDLVQTVRRLSQKVHQGVLAGIHLEGPWLSPSQRGAHDLNLLQTPRMQDVEELFEAGAGSIRMVTLAPELDTNLEIIRHLRRGGAVAAIGHTDATYEQTRAAIEAGATVGTHVFNAMRPIHHREPGPITALLENESMFAEVIADGIHLHPAIIRSVFNSRARPVLVTDAMAAAAAPEGRYTLGKLEVDVRCGEARLTSNGSIAGSTLTLDAALRYAVETAGIPFPQAIKALTEHPAAMLGLTSVGSIETGKRADLVVIGPELQISGVMRAGRWIPRSFAL